jgi:type II secretory pathway pseudopilin PulG
MIDTHRITRNNFTIVELLVVLVVVGILFSVSLAGLSRMLGRQGASGAVRSLSSQIALARSYAVVKNTYVAVLLPDDSAYTVKFDATPALQAYLFSKVRICVVKQLDASTSPATAQFDSWIDGNEWESLPSETCVSMDVVSAQVKDIDAASGLNSTAVIFKPSGVIVGDGTNPVCITVFMGKYVNGKLVYETKSGKKNAWVIEMNPFTGKSSYAKQTGN